MERGKLCDKLPQWADGLIQLGYNWSRGRAPWKRRIGVISMPCSSVGAPLIALGAVRKDLERDNANNIYGHFESLCRARDVYLADKSNSKGVVIDSSTPKHKKWKFFGGSSSEISVIDSSYKEEVRRKGVLVPNPNGPCKRFITEGNSRCWKFEGEQVVETSDLQSQILKEDYSGFPWAEEAIKDVNLSRSYSGLLLVGDGEGFETKYMQEVYSIKFIKGEQSVSLGKLLTLHPKGSDISRLVFSNHKAIEYYKGSHYLVIADGGSSFLKALSCFKESDVLGVISRDEPTQTLESIASKLAEIRRYYRDTDAEWHSYDAPPSISSLFMEGV